MPRTDVTQMLFARIYPLLANKVEKKGRTREELDGVIAWLTGYEPEESARLALSDIFRRAPAMHPNRTLITGKVCGVRVEEIEDPLLREIRRLDKLVDELAAGKSLDRIRR